MHFLRVIINFKIAPSIFSQQSINNRKKRKKGLTFKMEYISIVDALALTSNYNSPSKKMLFICFYFIFELKFHHKTLITAVIASMHTIVEFKEEPL